MCNYDQRNTKLLEQNNLWNILKTVLYHLWENQFSVPKLNLIYPRPDEIEGRVLRARTLFSSPSSLNDI